MVKLVITDVDGTIVGKDEILHDEMVQLSHRLHKAGIYYTIATGRADGLVAGYVQKLGLQVPHIACNGGVIIQNGKVLMRKTVALAPLRTLIETADAMGMSLLYSIEGHEEAFRQTEYVQQQQQQFGRYLAPHSFTAGEWEQLRLDKLIVMAKVRDGSLDAIEALCQKLPPEYGYKRYANKAIDILHRDDTKEQGLQSLCAMLGIGLHEVMAVGDDLNDIGMIQAAGIGVAVANALDCVKAAADYTAGQPTYLGVIEAAEKFCFTKPKGATTHE